MKLRILTLLCTAPFVVAACADQPALVEAGPPASLVIVAGDSQSVPAGTEAPQALTVRVTDSAGNPVKGQLVVFRVTAGGGSMYAGASITDAGGIARDRWTVGGALGNTQTVEARAVDNATGQRQLFGTFRARVLPGRAKTIELDSVGELTGVVGYNINVPVRILDAFNNRIPFATVRWSVVAGGGRVAKATTTADSNGVARATWAMGNAVGLNQLRAAVDSAFGILSVTTTPRSALRVEVALDSVFIDALGISINPYLSLTGIDGLGNRFPVDHTGYLVLDSAVVAGGVTAKNGRTRIVVKYRTLSDTLIVAVRQAATSVEISTGSRWGVTQGVAYKPTVTIRDRNSRAVVNAGESYVSSNPTVASVDTAGNITGHVVGGTFTVTVSVNGLSATTRELTVIAP